MIEADGIWQAVERRAAATPDAPFAIDEAGEVLSFRGLRERAERAAAGLHALGVGAGTRVAWLLPTRIAAFVLMAALARLGAVQNPLVPIYRRREIEFCMRQTGARWLLVPGAFRGFDYAGLAGELAAEMPDLETCELDTAFPDGEPATLPAAVEPTAGQHGPVRWIFYTSGTTADPKGARHTDRSLLLSSRALVGCMGLAPGDRTAAVFPITHLGGANALVSTLLAGSTQLVVESFDPDTSIPFLAEHGVTLAGAGTVFYRAYVEAQRRAGPRPILPTARALYGGGAPTPRQLHLDVQNELGGIPILSTWGMTECPVITMTRHEDPEDQRISTEGRLAVPGSALRVVSADGTEVPTGEVGELLVRAPQLLRGFVDASLDADAFDTDGFFRTGDLGSVDADGYVSITGRRKDVIIRKGENISAPEIEALLEEHPKVAEVAVIGLPDPDRGERCCAVVRANDPSDPLRFDEMTAYLEERELMRQKIPEQLEHIDELPRNPSGKVVKASLQTRFGAA